MSYIQAIIIGVLQGVTELFPISSLGHSVLVPAWLGWENLVGSQSSGESFYLAFLVGLHLATAVALLVHYRRDWVGIGRGLIRSTATRRITTPEARLGWLLIVATIPVGVLGLIFEHSLRTLFAKPLAAAVFLTVNGVILLGGELVRRRVPVPVRSVGAAAALQTRSRSMDELSFGNGLLIGAAEILALFAGISRSGVTMVAGLLRGLDHEHAARFSFMLATPVILAAGLYKLPDLLGPNGNGIRGQILVGSIVAGLAAYASVRFLDRFFRANTLLPFAVYSLAVGSLSILRFA